MQKNSSTPSCFPPLNWKIVTAAMVSGIVLIAGIGYGIGRNQRTQQLEQVDADCATHQTQTRFYSQKSQQYYEELMNFKRKYLVAHAALEELTESYNKLQSEMVDLKEELLFYQQIVAPQKAGGRLKLHEIKITPLDEAGQYRYRVILVQTQKRKEQLVGNIELVIKGLVDGASKTLTWKELASDNKEASFNMKYFQTVTGTVQLPENFEPQQLTLQARLIVYGRRQAKPEIETNFEWESLR